MSQHVTERQAEAVLRAVRKRFKPWIDAGDEGPTLSMDWDWPHRPTPTILWEGGPYQWALLDPGGDIEEEFGTKVPPLELPAGVRTEPYNGVALCIYREEGVR